MPELTAGDPSGYPVTHGYVRRFWIPILGPGAVADLCRLAAAARSGRPLKLPVHVTALARHGLVVHPTRRTIAVVDRVRPLTATEIHRLPPPLRTEHRRLIARTAA